MDKEIIIGNKKYIDTGKSKYFSGYVVGEAIPSEEEQKIDASELLEIENFKIKEGIETVK